MDADQLKAYISDVLALLDCAVDSVTIPAGARVVVSITSPDSSRLIGTNGEHLQALNTIVRRMVEKKHGTEAANFLIDVNDFHENRLAALRANASELAQRTRLSREVVALDPMNSYERLVIHELFAEDPEIATSSEGEGKERHIVLKFKG